MTDRAHPADALVRRALSDVARLGGRGTDGRLPAAMRTVGALGLSVGVLAALFAAVGANPGHAIKAIWTGAGLDFVNHTPGNTFFFGQTVMNTVLLCLLGLTAAVPFSARLWNIGGEGQYVFGAFCAIAMVFTVPLGWPDWAQLLIICLAATLGGAIFAGVPGFLKASIGANEVITTLMMTFVALGLSNYAITGLWPSGNTNATATADPSTQLPVIWDGTLVTSAAPVALIAVVLVWLIMSRTGLGFQIRASGLNPNAARMNGMSIRMVTMMSFVIGGACAGFAGGLAIVGVKAFGGTLTQAFSANFGYIGIAVALVARLNPLWILPSAFLFASLRTGSQTLPAQVNLDDKIGQTIVALFVIMLLAFKVIRLRYAEAVQEAH